MGKKETDVVLNFKMDGQVQYAQTIKEINSVMNTASKEYKAHISAMGNDATATAKLSAEKKKLTIQLEGAEKRTQKLREAYEKSARETGENSEQTKKLYDQLLQAEHGENVLKNSLDKTNDALKEQGNVSLDTAEKIKKIEEAGDKVKGVGQGMTKSVTLPLMAIGTASIMAFNEVDEGMDIIVAKTGATGAELDKLEESFRNVAGDAPDTFEDVGKSIGEVNTRLGFTGEKLEQASGDFLTFAYVNEMDVESSIALVTRAMGDAGIEADNYGEVLDMLTVAGQKSGISVDKLAENLAKYGAPMRALGIDTKNSIALFAGWEKAGVNTEIAFSGMKKAISNWGKEGKDAGEEFKKTMQAIKDAPDIASATSLSIEAFGEKAGPDLADAIKGGRFEVDEYIQALDNAGGAMNQTFEDMVDPPDQMVLVMNNLKMIMSDLGTVILEMAMPIMQSLTEHLKKFSEWFTNLSPHTKEMIVKIGLIVAAIGPILVILGTLMGSVTKIITGVKMLGTVLGFIMSPVGLVILAIGALIAIFVILWNKFEGFRNFWKDTWDFIKSYFYAIVTTIKEVFSAWIDGIAKSFQNVFDTIKGVFDGVVKFVTGVFTGDWRSAWQGVIDIFDSIVGGIANSFKIPINAIIGMINGFLRGVNKIKIPKWVPGVGGKGINIPEIPQLAKGGHLLQGQAIVGEAGPELLTKNKNGTATVTPLSEQEKKSGIGGALQGDRAVEINMNIGALNANNMSEVDRLNRMMGKGAKKANRLLGGAK